MLFRSAQTLALALPAAGAVVVLARRAAVRLTAGAFVLVGLSGLILNRNLTAWMALVAGTLVPLGLRYRARAVLPTLALLVAVGALFASAPPLRDRAVGVARDLRAGEWDRLLSYRLGPWAAAVEMVGARALTGWGPGTFGAEVVPHRLRAEVRFRTRLVNPHLAGSYVEAHSDYLQALAELGVPAALAAMAAAGAVLGPLLRTAGRTGDPRAPEALVLCALLVAGAVAALTWFPLQRPSSAIPLLRAAGRGWRLVATTPAGRSAPGSGSRARLAWIVVALLALAAALGPELLRYGAERQLQRATAGLRLHVSGAAPARRPGAVPHWVATTARAAARHLPGDPRPLALAAAALLVAGRTEDGLAQYGEALTLGERPELMLNLGRAHALLGRTDAAQAAFLRAGWVSPAVLAWLPRPLQEAMRARIDREEAALRAGTRTEPPPPPEGAARPG